MNPSRLIVPIVCALGLLPLDAGADDVTECVSAFETGQVQRKQGALFEAKKTLTRCAERACPTAMQVQCGKWLDDLEREIPSVVVGVTVDGDDVLDVHVDMDGAPFTDKLSARGTQVNPGAHTFLITVPGFDRVERRLVIHEGEKLKTISVVLTRPKAAPSSAPPPPPPVAVRPVPTGVFIVGGLGVAALAVGAAFEIYGEQGVNKLRDSCSPDCSQSDVDIVHTRYVVGDTALTIGALGVIGAATWYFLRPTQWERPSVALLPGPTSLHLQGTF